MLKRLFLAMAIGLGAVAMAGAPDVTFVSEAQAFSLKKTVKKVGKGAKKVGKAVGNEAKRVGKSAARDVKRNAKAVGRGTKKVGRGAKNYVDKNVSVRQFGRDWAKVGKGAWRGAKKGAKKAGRAVGDTAKCVAKGGCGRIGRPPGPQIRDHR